MGTQKSLINKIQKTEHKCIVPTQFVAKWVTEKNPHAGRVSGPLMTVTSLTVSTKNDTIQMKLVIVQDCETKSRKLYLKKSGEKCKGSPLQTKDKIMREKQSCCMRQNWFGMIDHPLLLHTSIISLSSCIVSTPWTFKCLCDLQGSHRYQKEIWHRMLLILVNRLVQETFWKLQLCTHLLPLLLPSLLFRYA
jgi:hypothetical protein